MMLNFQVIGSLWKGSKKGSLGGGGFKVKNTLFSKTDKKLV